MTALLIAVGLLVLLVIGSIVVGFLCKEPDDEDLTTINKGETK